MSETERVFGGFTTPRHRHPALEPGANVTARFPGEADQWVEGTVRGASPWGLSLLVEREGESGDVELPGRETKERFYPWSSVVRVTLIEP